MFFFDEVVFSHFPKEVKYLMLLIDVYHQHIYVQVQ